MKQSSCPRTAHVLAGQWVPESDDGACGSGWAEGWPSEDLGLSGVWGSPGAEAPWKPSQDAAHSCPRGWGNHGEMTLVSERTRAPSGPLCGVTGDTWTTPCPVTSCDVTCEVMPSGDAQKTLGGMVSRRMPLPLCCGRRSPLPEKGQTLGLCRAQGVSACAEGTPDAVQQQPRYKCLPSPDRAPVLPPACWGAREGRVHTKPLAGC